MGCIKLDIIESAPAKHSSQILMGSLSNCKPITKKRGSTYRFGFNGQENDTEIKGTGNSYDFGARIYDPRIGRFLSIDPLYTKYAFWGGYSFAGNFPVNAIDENGEDVFLVIWKKNDGSFSHAAIVVSNYKEVEEQVVINGETTTQIRYAPDGTYTYYDLVPGDELTLMGAIFGVDAKYNTPHKINEYGDLFDMSIRNRNYETDYGTPDPPDGIIRITSDYETDEKVKKQLYNERKIHKEYHPLKYNCADYAKAGIEIAIDNELNTGETDSPHRLFNLLKTLQNSIYDKRENAITIDKNTKAFPDDVKEIKKDYFEKKIIK